MIIGKQKGKERQAARVFCVVAGKQPDKQGWKGMMLAREKEKQKKKSRTGKLFSSYSYMVKIILWPSTLTPDSISSDTNEKRDVVYTLWRCGREQEQLTKSKS